MTIIINNLYLPVGKFHWKHWKKSSFKLIDWNTIYATAENKSVFSPLSMLMIL